MPPATRNNIPMRAWAGNVPAASRVAGSGEIPIRRAAPRMCQPFCTPSRSCCSADRLAASQHSRLRLGGQGEVGVLDQADEVAEGVGDGGDLDALADVLGG
jgi:hypothetical protein